MINRIVWNRPVWSFNYVLTNVRFLIELFVNLELFNFVAKCLQLLHIKYKWINWICIKLSTIVDMP